MISVISWTMTTGLCRDVAIPGLARHHPVLLSHLVREVPLCVEEVAEAPRHARRHVPPDRPQADHAAARHVLAAVVPCALHDGLSHRVAHGKALAGAAVDKQAAAGGAVQAGVADDGR